MGKLQCQAILPHNMSPSKTKAFCVDLLLGTPHQNTPIHTFALERIHNCTKSLSLPLEDIKSSHTLSILEEILSKSEGFDNILLFHSNAPFAFPSLAKKVLERQEKFLVDYTFIEYLPWGLSPIAIRRDILENLVPFLKDSAYTPFLIDEYIKDDLNSYDIEIVLLENDYRFMKESFIMSDERSFSFLNRLFQKGLDSILEVSDFLSASIPLLRTVPSFFQVSLVYDDKRKALFQSPSLEPSYTLELSSLFTILKDLWAQNPLMVTQFSLQDGDPLSHPKINEVLAFIKENSTYEFILETLGNNLSNIKEKLLELSNVRLVFYLGATSEECYQKTHGQQNLTEKENLIEDLLRQKEGQTYIQWVRMKENEEELAPFLKRWKAYEKQILISQYNYFSGQLIQRKVADFSPLNRFPCFSLLRELYLRADGNFALCGAGAPPKILSSISSYKTNPSLFWENLWTKLGSIYESHSKGNYSEPCEQCDYWYIFNL